MSDKTTGSKRCCNRRGCPYYQRTVTHRHIGTTPYASANEGTSTQFLYFGPNFVGSPSGEIREFQDCLSETDVPLGGVPSLAQSLHQAATMLAGTDSVNYEIMLRQIISISHRLLQHMNKSDPRHMRGDISGMTPPAIAGIGGTTPTGAMGGTTPADGTCGTGGTCGRMGGQSPAGGMGRPPPYGGMGRALTPGMAETSAYADTQAIGSSSPYGAQYGTTTGMGITDDGMAQAAASGVRYGTPALTGLGETSATSRMDGTPAYGTTGVPAYGTTGVSGDAANRMNQYNTSAVPSRTTPFEQANANYGMISRFGDVGRDNVGAGGVGANAGALSPLNAASAMPVQHIPIDLRLLRIEPVNLNIPFTLHFQTTLPPAGTDDQRPFIIPSVSLEPIRTATIAPPPPSYPPPQPYASPPQAFTSQQPFPPAQTYVPPQLSATAPTTAPQFPYSPDEQANMFVSQGQFPPIMGQTSSYGNMAGARPKEEPMPSQLSQEPIFLQQPWTYPQGEQKEASDLGQVPSSAASVLMEVDKAVQTEKPVKANQAQLQPQPPPPPPPLELETEAEAEEKYSQTDSHRDHSYIIPTAETDHLASSSPNEQFDQVKLYKTEFTLEDELTAITQATTTERWTGGQMEENEEQTEQSTTPPPETQDRATSTRRSREEEEAKESEKAQRQSELDALEQEQAKYEKPPPPLDLSNGSPLKIPDTISYPTQYGRNTTPPPPAPQQEAEQQTQQQPEQPCRPQMVSTCTGTSITCFSTTYNAGQPCDMNFPPPPPSISVNMCCRCGSRKRKSRGHKQPASSASSKESRLCLQSSSRSHSIKRSSSIRFGDEDYYTAESESEAEMRKKCAQKKKVKCPKKSKSKPPCSRSVSVMHVGPMSPEQCMMLKVMEQMMRILCRMDAAQRGISTAPDDSSVKTLYQSSRTEAMGEESTSLIPCSEYGYGDNEEDAKSGVAPSALTNYEAECAEEQQPSLRPSKTRRVSLRTDDDEAGEESGVVPCSTRESSARIEQRSSNVDDGAACAAAAADTGASNLPILVITFDRETGMPCCCVHSGALTAPCQSIPVFDIQPCGGSKKRVTSVENEACEESRLRTETLPFSEECYCDEEAATRFELHIHDQMQIIQQGGDYGEGNEGGLVDITMERVELSTTMQMECDEECRAVCEATQTEECISQWRQSKTGQEVVRMSTDMMDEIREYREEYCDYAEEEDVSCRSSRKSKTKIRSSKTKSGGDITGVACDCCHCRAERESKLRKSLTATQSGEAACLNAEDCKHQLKSIVDSIITDLECMEKVRKRMSCEQSNSAEIVPKTPPQHARQSFPVTILEVCELGLSSLYVKWVIHDCFGIGGYEIYVDGYLTNRYYNARHEAAVICDVDVTQSHKVCLLAKPKAEKALLGAGDLLDEDCRPPVTPATWSPSVFLYEPSPDMDYCKRFR